MANEIKLITFADSEVTATDDAYVYESAIGEGGIINGCEVTIKNASELHINGGNGVLCGRKFTVYDSDLPVTLSSSGTLLGRLYIHMDLSNASTPIQLMIETGGSLTPVQQDADVNATNGIYEINLSTFNVDTSTISDLVDVSPKVYTHEVLNTIEECVASTNPGDIAGASVAATLNSKIEQQDKVSVTADGVKTYRQLFNELYALIDRSKLSNRSTLWFIYTNGTIQYYNLGENSASWYCFSLPMAGSAGAKATTFIIASTQNVCEYSASVGSTRTDYSTYVPQVTTVFEVHY